LLLAVACFSFMTFSVQAADESPLIRLNTSAICPARKNGPPSPCRHEFYRQSASPTIQRFLPAKSPGRFESGTQEQLGIADFSKLKKPGDYQLVVPGMGRSAPFRIAQDVYHEPYYVVMRGFYLWRCGTAVSATCHGETFSHAACHTNDAWLDHVGGGHTNKDGTKGWHDAAITTNTPSTPGSRLVPCSAPGRISAHNCARSVSTAGIRR